MVVDVGVYIVLYSNKSTLTTCGLYSVPVPVLYHNGSMVVYSKVLLVSLVSNIGINIPSQYCTDGY